MAGGSELPGRVSRWGAGGIAVLARDRMNRFAARRRGGYGLTENRGDNFGFEITLEEIP